MQKCRVPLALGDQPCVLMGPKGTESGICVFQMFVQTLGLPRAIPRFSTSFWWGARTNALRHLRACLRQSRARPPELKFDLIACGTSLYGALTKGYVFFGRRGGGSEFDCPHNLRRPFLPVCFGRGCAGFGSSRAAGEYLFAEGDRRGSHSPDLAIVQLLPELSGGYHAGSWDACCYPSDSGVMLKFQSLLSHQLFSIPPTGHPLACPQKLQPTPIGDPPCRFPDILLQPRKYIHRATCYCQQNSEQSTERFLRISSEKVGSGCETGRLSHLLFASVIPSIELAANCPWGLFTSCVHETLAKTRNKPNKIPRRSSDETPASFACQAPGIWCPS